MNNLNSSFFIDLLNVFPGGILVLDDNKNVRYGNDKICDLLQYTKVELLNINLKDLVSNDNNYSTIESELENLGSKNSYSIDLWVFLKNKLGEVHNVFGCLNSMTINGNKYAVFFVKENSLNVLESDSLAVEQYKGIVEAAEDLIFSVDVNGNFVYVNKEAVVLTKYSKKELYNMNFIDLVSASFKKEIGAFFHHHFLSKKDKARLSFPIKSSSGDVYWIDQKLITIWNLDKTRITGYSAVARNVTKEREKEEQLRVSQEQYQKLFRDSPVAKRIEDFSQVKKYLDKKKKQGITDFDIFFNYYPEEIKVCASMVRVIEKNNAVLKLYGAISESDLNANIQEVFTTVTYETFKKELIAIVNGDSFFEDDTEVRTISGETRFVQLRWVPMPGYEKSLERVIVTTVDITERILSARLLKENQDHYKKLFTESTVPFRLESYEKVLPLFDELRKKGISDLRKYLSENSKEAMSLVSKIQHLEINNEYLNLFKVKNFDELYEDPQKYTTQNTYIDFIDDLHQLYTGVKEFERETEIINKAGELRFLRKKWTVLKGHEKKLDRIFISSIDITNKKNAEKKIKESDRFYQALFNESPIPLWLEDLSGVKRMLNDIKNSGVKDLGDHLINHPELVIEITQNLNIIQVNNEVLRLHKAKNFTHLLENLGETFTEESLRGFTKLILQLANNSPEEVITELSSLQGDKMIISLKWQPLPGYEKSLEKVFVSTIDITKIHQDKEKIRENEELLSTIFSNITIPILISDPNTAKIIEFNKNALETTGYNLDELKGKYIYDIDADHDEAYVVKSLQRCKTEGLVQGNTRWITKNDEIRDITVKNSLINIKGKDRVLSAIMDVTENKKLNAENERFRLVMNDAPFGIYLTDTNGRILDVNNTAVTQSGYSRNELCNMNVSALEQTDIIQDPKKEQDFYAGMLTDSETRKLDGVHKRKDGTTFPVKVTVNARIKNGEGYIIASIFDDTQGKMNIDKLEQQNVELLDFKKKLSLVNNRLNKEVELRKIAQLNLVKTEELERKRVAQELHDGLGQKLTAVKFSLGAVKNANKLDEPQLEILKESILMIEESMHEVREMSHNLMPVVLSDYGIEAALSKLCSRANVHSICKVEFRKQGVLQEVSDQIIISLYRIAQEAINNAVKYAKATNIIVKLQANKKSLVVSIQDNGVGFDAKLVLQKEGLGLSNIKERSKLIGASCLITSSEGKGTIISVRYEYNK